MVAFRSQTNQTEPKNESDPKNFGAEFDEANFEVQTLNFK